MSQDSRIKWTSVTVIENIADILMSDVITGWFQSIEAKIFLFVILIFSNYFGKYPLKGSCFGKTGRTQSVIGRGQLSKEVKVTLGVHEGSVLCPLLFLVYLNDIWSNVDMIIRLYADDCIIYRKIINKNNIEKLEKNLDTLVRWAV